MDFPCVLILLGFSECYFCCFTKCKVLQLFFHQVKCWSSFLLCLVSLSQRLYYDDSACTILNCFVYYTNSCNSQKHYFSASAICNCSSSMLLLLYTTQQNKTLTCTSTSIQSRVTVHCQTN